jgi:toxin ParE1/3/4
MNYRLSIEPEAEAEIDEISRWYGERDETLGVDFLRAVDDSLAAILENPFQYQIVHGRKRRVPLTRFPFRLIYVVAGEAVM